MGIVCLNLKFTKDLNPGVKKAHTPAPLLIEGKIPALQIKNGTRFGIGVQKKAVTPL